MNDIQTNKLILIRAGVNGRYEQFCFLGSFGADEVISFYVPEGIIRLSFTSKNSIYINETPTNEGVYIRAINMLKNIGI